MDFPRDIPRTLLPVLLLGVLAVAACDNTVAPFAQGPAAHYSIAGFLDADADTQYVRVDALRATVASDSGSDSVPLGAEVTSLDDETGGRVVWQDSLVRLDDGTHGHLFYAPFRPIPGFRYTLAVTSDDGRRTTASTRVPPPLALDVGAVVDTAGREPYQTVTWVGLRRAPETVVVRYVVRAPAAAVDTFAFSYTPLGDLTPRGLAFDIYLARDRALILNRLGRDPADSSLALVDLQLSIRRRSEAWYGTGEENVEAGFGFFGSVSTTAAAWTLDAEGAARVGFRGER